MGAATRRDWWAGLGSAVILEICGEAPPEVLAEAQRRVRQARRQQAKAAERRRAACQANGMRQLADGRVEDGGTPELQARRRACVIARLQRQGRLSIRETVKAGNIAAAAEAAAQSDCPSKWCFERVQTSSAAVRDPLGRLAPEAQAAIARFRRWRGELLQETVVLALAGNSRRAVQANGSLALAVALAVILRNAGLAEAERACGVPRDNGYGLALLRAALARW